MKFRLIDRWHKKLFQLWSTRIALFWGAVCGFVIFMPSLQNVLPLWQFALVCMGMCAAMAWARVTKQPGVE